MKKYKKPSKSTKECIEAGGAFTPSVRDYIPKQRKKFYSKPSSHGRRARVARPWRDKCKERELDVLN